MEIFGIGPLELLLIALLALILIGPRDLQKAMGTAGRWLRKVSRSEFWRGVEKVRRAARTSPQDLMQEADLEAWRQKQEAPTVRPPAPEGKRPPLVESWVADPRPPDDEPPSLPSEDLHR